MQSPGNPAAGSGSSPSGVQHQRFSCGSGQQDVHILRYDADQRQPGLIHDIVHSLVQSTDELGIDPIDDEPHIDSAHQLQHLAGETCVPDRSGVRVGNHKDPICIQGGEPEAGIQSGRGIHQHIVIFILGIFDHQCKGFPVNVGRFQAHRSGEKPESGEIGVGLKLLQQIIALSDVQKIQSRFLGNTQCDIQIAKTNVTVDAQDPLAFFCKGSGDTGTDGGLTRTAFSGQKRNGFTHVPTPP